MTVTGRAWAAAAVILLAVLPACSSHHRTTAGSAAGSGSSSAGASSSPSATASSGKPSGAKPSSAKPSGSAGQPSASGTASGGSEGSTTGQVEKCPVTGTAAVGAAFAATVAHEQVGTSGIGSPLCTFDLSHAKSAVFGAVSATTNSNYPAAAFAQSRKSSSGAQTVPGLGTSAFYVPANHTLKVLAGSTALTLQYSGYLAGSAQPTADRIRSALITIARGYLSQR